ncbi:MAG: PVC-type heme-binding CxxCH protein [Planctomycetaceae bacterium]
MSTACAADEAPAPLPPLSAATTMIVPEGFHVSLFAGEPDVQQPIGFCIDDRGRLWVAEAYSYPHHSSALPMESSAVGAVEDKPPRDRILIFEDSDNDGTFDVRKVFFEGLNYVTGVEVGFGGAWVMSPPYFLFIPDRDRNDVPDAAPQVLLDGFGNHANSHNLANGFAWGPDGWLYATHGRTNWSTIGPPGTNEQDRGRFDGGVWRYHPTRHIWEPYCDGTTNPWGIDWDDWGEAFISNCVNPHLFHVIPGAHYEPWRDRESSRYAYQRIATIADHFHYTGAGDVREGLGSDAENVAGGGHAHCGAMVYLGDNWPRGYRNSVFLNNLHGKRINNDVLKRSGSGYVASHAPDILRSQDPWMMGVTLQYGPDGSVYLLDWSDTGECHSVKNTQRQTGRIFRIAYGTPEPRRLDVATMSNSQLVDLQRHPNDWFVRHARRRLQERQSAGQDLSKVTVALKAMLQDDPDVTRRLRALWTLHALSALSDGELITLLADPDEHLQAWAITLLCEDREPPPIARTKFHDLAAGESTPLVRLHLASSLQRLKEDQRWSLAAALVARADDAHDQNLPLMNWYAIAPLFDVDPTRFVEFLEVARIPLVRQLIARRIGEIRPTDRGYSELLARIELTDDRALRRDLLTGLFEGAQSRGHVPMPPPWPKVYRRISMQGDADTRELALSLGLLYGDPDAIRDLQSRATDRQADVPLRTRAIQELSRRQLDDWDGTLISLLDDDAVRSAAIRGLAEFNNRLIPVILLQRYARLAPDERQDVLQTLSARRDWAVQLVDAVASQAIPRADLTALTVRQIYSLGDDVLNARLTQLWGELRSTPADRLKAINALKPKLADDILAKSDPAAGRVLFKKLCANCHRLFDDGQKVGPELTGSQRRNLDYLLENILDPNASVARDYQLETLVLDSGRVLSGLVIGETDAGLTLATANERIVVPRNEIQLRDQKKLSLMPEGLLRNLSLTDIRNLVKYLQSDQQVPLP